MGQIQWFYLRDTTAVSIHFSPESTKQADNLSFSIFKKKVRQAILTFQTNPQFFYFIHSLSVVILPKE